MTTSAESRKAAGLFLAAALATAIPAEAASETNQKDGVALAGYDAVAYFSDAKPVKGDAAISYSLDGVTYRFASAANRDAFAEQPSRYLPQYGGWCAYGLSRGYKAPIDPAAFTVRDGKLYLNYSLEVQTEWRKDPAGYIVKADKNWPTVRHQ